MPSSLAATVWLTGVAVAAGLTVYALNVESPAWEAGVIRAVQDASPTQVRDFAGGVSFVGETWALVVTSILAVAVMQRARRSSLAWAMVGALALRWSAPLLKSLIDRPRPAGQGIDVTETFEQSAFPGAHALGAALIYGFLIYAVAQTVAEPRLRRAMQGVLAAGIVLMGWSRIELGAHWPTDILGGWLIGGLLACAVMIAHQRVAR